MYKDKIIHFWMYRNHYDREGISVRLPQHKMDKDFLKYRIRDEKNGAAFCPAIMNGTRSKKNVKEITMLVFDIDDGTSVGKNMCFWGTKYYFYTSFSHDPDGKHKWRIVFPLENPIPAADWNRAWIAAMEFWKEKTGLEHGPDQQCKDPSRIYYMPATNRYADTMSYVQTAKEWPWLDLKYDHIEIPKPIIKSNPSPTFDQTSVQYYGRGSIIQQIIEQYNTDEHSRRWLASRLVGVDRGDRFEKIICPFCSRPSLYFYYAPIQSPAAICGHRNSCGKSISLYNLSKYNNID
jgi:hypothetical protein